MYISHVGFLFLAALLLWTGCAASSGVSSSDLNQRYDLPFDLVREHVLEAAQKSGFRIESASFDGAHIFLARAIHDSGASRIEMSGNRNRSYRSVMLMKVERLDAGQVEVSMSNPARRANYGSSSSTRRHDRFFAELDRIIEQN